MRLQDELRRFLDHCPPQARTASGLSRHLGVDRTTCQRAVNAAGVSDAGADLIERLPGIKGLRGLVEAAHQTGIEPAATADITAAIENLEEVIRTTAGSQSKLIRLVAATPGSPVHARQGSDPDGRCAARRRLFEAAAELTGRSSETAIRLFLVRAHPEDDRALQRMMVGGVLEHVRSADALPVVFATGRYHDAQDVPAQETDSAGAPEIVLTEFSTDPPPALLTHLRDGQEILQMVDSMHEPGTPLDILVANLTGEVVPHPLLGSPPIAEIWNILHYPARRLLLDVYLHQDLARMCIPSVDVHNFRPDLHKHIGSRAHSRFPHGPRLELLGRGVANAHCAISPRHAELTSYAFDESRWPAEEFIGFRCLVEYPMWRCGYCVSFDFTGAPTA